MGLLDLSLPRKFFGTLHTLLYLVQVISYVQSIVKVVKFDNLPMNSSYDSSYHNLNHREWDYSRTTTVNNLIIPFNLTEKFLKRFTKSGKDIDKSAPSGFIEFNLRPSSYKNKNNSANSYMSDILAYVYNNETTSVEYLTLRSKKLLIMNLPLQSTSSIHSTTTTTKANQSLIHRFKPSSLRGKKPYGYHVITQRAGFTLIPLRLMNGYEYKYNTTSTAKSLIGTTSNIYRIKNINSSKKIKSSKNFITSSTATNIKLTEQNTKLPDRRITTGHGTVGGHIKILPTTKRQHKLYHPVLGLKDFFKRIRRPLFQKDGYRNIASSDTNLTRIIPKLINSSPSGHVWKDSKYPDEVAAHSNATNQQLVKWKNRPVLVRNYRVNTTGKDIIKFGPCIYKLNDTSACVVEKYVVYSVYVLLTVVQEARPKLVFNGRRSTTSLLNIPSAGKNVVKCDPVKIKESLCTNGPCRYTKVPRSSSESKCDLKSNTRRLEYVLSGTIAKNPIKCPPKTIILQWCKKCVYMAGNWTKCNHSYTGGTRQSLTYELVSEKSSQTGCEQPKTFSIRQCNKNETVMLKESLQEDILDDKKNLKECPYTFLRQTDCDPRTRKREMVYKLNITTNSILKSSNSGNKSLNLVREIPNSTTFSRRIKTKCQTFKTVKESCRIQACRYGRWETINPNCTNSRTTSTISRKRTLIYGDPKLCQLTEIINLCF